MNLPPSLQTYFTADVTQDAALAEAFAPDAVVVDEHETYRGRAAIRTWWHAAKARYRHRADPLDVAEAKGKLVVRARVSGDFPGSPAVLTFTFGLVDDRISTLSIG